ncbi:MAG TPA: hypothetical protein VIM89_18345 [Mucilaginibacter sp.]
MKKPILICLFLLAIIQFSKAQTIPLEIYSSNRFWKSDKTKTGSGFKFRNTTTVKQPYVFTIYKYHITFKDRNFTTYKINKVEAKWSDATHYLVSDLKGQTFMVIKSDIIIDNKHTYNIEIIKTAKDGKELAVTMYDVKKVK